MKLLAASMSVLFIFSAAAGVHAVSPETVDMLWYQTPAKKWIEALPVGNGRLGAMVFGGAASEHLALNDITVWSGGPQPDANRPDGWKHLSEIRQAIRQGRFADADKLTNEHLTCRVNYDLSKYQALGDLKLDFVLPPGEVADYRRWLDIGRALAGVEFKAGGAAFTREVFSSAPDKVLVQRITASQPGSVNFALALSRSENARTRFVAPDTLVMTGNTGPNLDYEVRVRVSTKGGIVKGEGDRLTVEHADEALLLLTAATSYVADYERGYKGADPVALAAQQMEAAEAKDYDQLKAEHVADYQKYFQRVNLDLGMTDAGRLPTDERLRSFSRGTPDPALATLFFQYGRYLLISCSRPDNPVPANLQGLWAEGTKTPWNGDYTLNINFEMNYWPAEVTALGEMHLPMLRHAQSLVAPGSKTAQAVFGPDTPGWVTGPKSNVWGWASSGARLSWGVWFGSNGWLCQHLWEHYAFGGDKEYLREVYPTMKGACEFWLGALVEDADGKLVSSPSTSPENTFFTDEGVQGSVCEGTAMDKAIIWELFDNTARACAALGQDADFKKRIEAARERLQPQRIGKAGQLMEWSGDWDLNAKEPHHRHPSHLYALHPGAQISVDGTPSLAAAARKSLELRGDEGTGWSKAWKINLWARLRDGDHAYRLLCNQLTPTEEISMRKPGGTYPNLFDAHPPFQIDGNFGATSGMTLMFLQSQEWYTDPAAPDETRYLIDLLPALPGAWPDGSIKGLRARGGYEVDLAWRDGKLTGCWLRASKDGACKVRYADKVVDVQIAKGDARHFGPGLAQ